MAINVCTFFVTIQCVFLIFKVGFEGSLSGAHEHVILSHQDQRQTAAEASTTHWFAILLNKILEPSTFISFS